jgi:hypothetical protein
MAIQRIEILNANIGTTVITDVIPDIVTISGGIGPQGPRGEVGPPADTTELDAATLAAATSASAAATSETNAATSASAAATSETNAATSASNASTSETNAATSASNASTSETNAATSASAAATSETNASNSASSAATSASAAATSETNAATSASNASNSASAAATSETNASTSETNAATSASAAATSETNASTSETNAATSASAAATSETNAATSASNAATSASAAATSETNAATSASNASTSETNASNSASAAATSETNAGNSASAAATSASNASTSETNASNSASAAATSASNASTSETNALAALDEFTDLYLGAKGSEPTLDNDGNPLQIGAFYFDTLSDNLRVYTSLGWSTAVLDASGFLVASNNLSDLTNTAAARTNLGLGTAATTASTDYATAAQGALADSALQPAAIGTTVQGYSAVLAGTTASFTTADETKLDGIETGATADQTSAEIKTAYESNANTNAFTDAEKTKLTGIEAGAEANVVDSVNTQTGAVVLDADDISDTATTNKFTTAAEISKLSGIETGATADQTGAEIKTAYEAEADTNAYTDAEKTKLAGIETGATADQTSAEIKTAYESNANTNAFTDAQVTKLAGIETGADVTDTANVTAAGAVMNTDSSTENMNFVIDEDSMLTNSATQVPTQQSVKAYVDAAVASQVTYQGGYNAATNTPDLDTSPTNVSTGDMYTVTVAGTFFTKSLEIGDVIIAEIDNANAEAEWTIVNKDLDAPGIKTAYESNANTNAFTDAEKTKLTGIETGATADQTGAEILAALIPVDGATSLLDADLLDGQHGAHYLDYNNFTNTPSIPSTTSDITEGTNLYYTASRANAAIDARVTTSFVNLLNVDADTLDGLDSTAFATAAQGALADTALQSSDIGVTVQGYSAVLAGTTASFTTADETKLDGIETGATADQTGAEIKTAYEAEANTNAYTDAEKTKLTGIEAGATADQTGAEIKTAYEAEANTNAFTDAQVTKLAGIETGATADQTGAEIKTAYEAEADTNAFTDAQVTKLAGIEAGATADQTSAEIKTAYESNANTNAFTDAEKTKLTGIETGADVTDTANVTAAGALMDSEVTNLAAVKSFNPASYATAAQGTSADTAFGWGDHAVAGYATVTGTQTLTNKTLTAPVITGTIIEDVYAISGTTPALEPANGSVQTWTLTANSTPTDSIAAGEGITLMIDDGASRTITWPTITWVNNAGAAPTLATTGYTVIALWKVSTTLYGALVGNGT